MFALKTGFMSSMAISPEYTGALFLTDLLRGANWPGSEKAVNRV